MKYIWNECNKFDTWLNGLSTAELLVAFTIMIGIPAFGIAGIFFSKTIAIGGFLFNAIFIHNGLMILLWINKKKNHYRAKKQERRNLN